MDARYRSEIECLYLQMYNQLFEYARSSLSSDALAEEAVQETFRIACQKPDALCTCPNPEGWLVNTLKNVIANMKRSRTVANRILKDYYTLQIKNGAVSNDREELEILYDDIAQSEEFKLLKEMAIDGMSHLEMARLRGISVEACRKRVERAKKLLKEKLLN